MGINQVLSKIAKINEPTELASHQVELGAIDDLQVKYKNIASKAPKIKDQVIRLSNELAGVSSELKNLSADFKKLQGMAKELGAMDVEKTAITLAQLTATFSSDWGKAATNISAAAKTI
jgi:small-conductance mechanosensitive channel